MRTSWLYPAELAEGAAIGHPYAVDAASVKAMLEQHFASDDPDVSHAMYHDDAVLEFPQSGERFVGVESFRQWRSDYPASTKVEFREIGPVELKGVPDAIRLHSAHRGT